MNNVSPEVRAVLVVNDYLDRDFWQEELYKMWINVEGLGTEFGFRERLSGWREYKPDVFVLGARVKWTDPAPDMPEPTEDVVAEGYHRRTGLRMQRYITTDPVLRDIPVIILGFESDAEEFYGKDGTILPSGALFVNRYSEVDNPGILALTIRSLAMASR